VSAPSSFLRRHRWLTWAAALAVPVVLFGLWLFEPQALFIDNTVSESAPAVDTTSGADPNDGSGSRAELSRGTFRPLAHAARGHALVIDAADGKTYVRFEDFEVENGPDLRVYLSQAAADAPDSELAAEFIDLGDLKGNIGEQNYLVPDSADLSKFQSVVVWCRRFSVGFAVAPIDVRSS
jgi:Electron transfer DM13